MRRHNSSRRLFHRDRVQERRIDRHGDHAALAVDGVHSSVRSAIRAVPHRNSVFALQAVV